MQKGNKLSILKTGRQTIYSSELEITRDNVVSVLKKALPIFNKNKTEIQYLHDYYRNSQPIRHRKKKIRPEICNNIVENHAFEIVDFKKGYVFGEPIQYVCRGERKDLPDGILTLNDYMLEESKSSHDIDLAEWLYICGTSYRMVLPKDSDDGGSPFEIDVLDARQAFIVYSNRFGKKPLMGVMEIPTDEKESIYAIYTKTKYFEVIGEKIVKEEAHILGGIPIIEYPANRLRIGAFEPVLDMLDAINTTASNRVDGIEQFVQAFLKFTNCKFEQEHLDKLKEQLAIAVMGEPGLPADVSLVTAELNQGQVQISKDDMYQIVLIICGVPDRRAPGVSTSDTGQAVLLGNGWVAAEGRAKDTERIFIKSEKQFLKIVLNIIKNSRKIDIQLKDIDIKFTRNKTDNLLVKTQALQTLLESGMHPQIAISIVGLFSDPEQVYLDSKEYLEKWKVAEATRTPANNKAVDVDE